MDWRLAGQAQTVILEFLVDGQPVVPDANSIQFTAWGHDGTVVQQYNVVQPPDAIPTQMEAALSVALSDIALGTLFEARYFRADFKYKTKPFAVQKSYRLHRMIPMTADQQSVRGLVGADFNELPDVDIDLIGAYFDLIQNFGTNLDVALRTKSAVSTSANRAISLQAAVTLLPSFQSRLLKSEKSDNAGFQRADMDFQKLEADLRAQLSANLDAITAAISGTETTFELPTIFAVTKQTDRITNSDS